MQNNGATSSLAEKITSSSQCRKKVVSIIHFGNQW